MGREWSWGSRSTTTRRAERENSGCMSGVLQLFDFHQFQFPLHQPCFNTPESFLQEDPTILKGIEAPRNSLESEEDPCMETVHLSSITKECGFNFPMAIRVGTKVDNTETSTSPVIKTPNLVARLMGLDLSPSSSSSTSSTSSSVHANVRSRIKPHQDNHLKEKLACAAVKRDLRSYEMSGSRSLPDTPRISSARRSSETVPRLSLQINKENNLMIPPEEFASRNSFSCSPYSTKSRKKEWRQEDENRSPSYYARQIVKQVKENVVGRKMGLDITNTTRNRASEGDSPTIKSQKTKRQSLTKVEDESSPSKHSTPSSCSPRLRFLKLENKPVMATSTSHSPRPSSQRPPPPPLSSSTSSCSTDNELQPKTPRKPKAQAQPSNQPATTKSKKGSRSGGLFTQRLTKPPQISETVRNMREEAFVRANKITKANLSDKKCKKTPLYNDLVNIAVPSVVPLKKNQQQSSTNQKQVAQGSKRSSQLSSCLSQKYNRQEETETLACQDDSKGNSSNKNGGSDEFRYVNGILKSTGIYRDAFVSVTKWFSPYHPLNPLIFHHLEGEEREEEEIDQGPMRHRCNRKLMFQLVDEILVEELRPYVNMKPWLRFIYRGLLPAVSISKETQITGLQLLDRLWSRIQNFPAANCQILQDIDALVEMDLPDATIRTVLSYSDEGESIVFEIERDILDSLLHETVTECRR